jgi:hypothetical protein
MYIPHTPTKSESVVEVPADQACMKPQRLIVEPDNPACALLNSANPHIAQLIIW